jgi:hypothetical protein
MPLERLPAVKSPSLTVIARCLRLKGPRLATLALATLLFPVGCQSPATAPAAALEPAQARPVIVRDFLFDVAQLHTDPSLVAGREGPVRHVLGRVRPQETPEQQAVRLSRLLSETMVQELVKLKIPARRESAGVDLPANALLVAGQFMEMDERNRLKRVMVGFGSGATEVLVQVAVYDLRQSREQPVLVYGTGTGSKPMPGAVVTMNPYAMAARYVLSRNGDEKDVQRLGRQIAQDLAQMEAGGPPRP